MFIKSLLIPLCIFLAFSFLEGKEASRGKIQAVYNSLDPKSIAQHLAFYELYPDTPEGQEALKEAWKLLCGDSPDHIEKSLQSEPFLRSAITGMVALVNKQSDQPLPILAEQELAVIDRLAIHLPNRKLKGFYAQTEAEVLQLPPEEIDLGRALFLSQLGESQLQKIRSYEAQIDLMSLQIAARLPKNALPAIKIRTINDYIFGEMGFRFPPHSEYAEEIDVYTFLPSVLDSRRGVCLGVSILYLCLAQRLDLPLEMITPPGHIYVRYHLGSEIINIETTARGVHIDSEEYLSIGTRALQQRNIKEVVGLAHINHASVFWIQKKYPEALTAYQRAAPYLPHNKQVIELMGYQHLLLGQIEEGKKLLEKIRGEESPYVTMDDGVAEDYLAGNVDTEGIQAIFLPVDETRESLIAKKMELEKILNKFPHFRAGLLQLATTWIQMHRMGEALAVLERYHGIEPKDPTVEYYLTVLYAQRSDDNRAWEHLRHLEELMVQKKHHPKLLTSLRRELARRSPE